MKKMLLSVAVAAALSGCGGGDSLEDIKNETGTVIPASTVVFDPANGVISVPNDLLMSGTKDGTLNLPGEDAENVNYADPNMVLGALDGWSSQTPFKIDLKFPAGVSLDAASAGTPGSVRIFEVVMGADQSSEACKAVPAGIACQYVGELTFGVDFITQGSGDAVAVIPLRPFKTATTYITTLTTALKDSEGRSIEPSSTYGLVKQSSPLVTDSQKALQAVIGSYESVVTSQGAISKDEIIYSAAMTIESAGLVLGTIKKVLAASLQEPSLPTPALTVPAQPAITVANVLAMGGVSNVPAVFNGIAYEKGSIMLPMYLKTPTATGLSALSDTYWQALCDSGVAVAGYKALAGDSFPSDPISVADGTCAALSGGALRDLGLDSQRHLTKYNSIPKTQSISNVPVQITKPGDDLTILNAARAQYGLPAMSMPDGGWPVVILMHGIGRQKEDMLGITAALAMQGFATVAIDHPLHGERGIDVDGDGNDDFNATTVSSLAYMNLSSLLVARDSLRQSAADLMGLRLGMNFLQDASLNTSDVSFFGQSLGAVGASAFIGSTNAPINPAVDPLFKINAAAFAPSASGIASFLLESELFGPLLQGSVLTAAGTAESAEFGAYMQNEALANCGALAANQEAYVSCAYKEYVGSLTMGGEVEKLANIQSVMASFTFVAQSALDAADGANYAAALRAFNTPIYMSAVVGDGADNKADTVIPVSVTSNPISGTLPFANLLGMTTVTETQMTEEPMSYLVKFTKGHHASSLSPATYEGSGATAADSAAANAEMQLQIATFLASRGRMMMVANPSILTD